MRRSSLLPFFLLLLISCHQTSSVPDAGVPLSLAEQRKQQISKVGYELHFDIPGNRDASIQATEIIRFHTKHNNTDLALDFKADSGSVHSLSVNGKPQDIHHEQEHIMIDKGSLEEGENTIEIHFEAGISALNRNEDYLYALLVPDRARTVFPCFDQPDLKAAFTLSLKVPEGWKAMSNGAVGDSSSSKGSSTFHFLPSDTISTYLFSFTAGKFQVAEKEMEGRTMRLLYRENDGAKLTASLPVIFDLHERSLRFMEEYTGILYPFQQFHFAAIPDFQFGGMEHPGAIWYNAGSLFLDTNATRTQLIRRANLIAHEVSHNWFGNLVTMRWFNDVWMKEVFANFMADKFVEQALPDRNAGLKFVLAHYPAAYSVDRTPGANPIRQQLDNLQEAGSMYGNIIYHKAPIMMLQLERLMGKEALRDGLREYLRKHAFSNASWPDLIAILKTHTQHDLQSWNDQWVNKAGLPSYNHPVSDSVSYGLFTVDSTNIEGVITIQDPVLRTLNYLNLYENMLDGKYVSPEEQLPLIRRALRFEKEELVIRLLLDQLNEIYWQFISSERRNSLAAGLEDELWKAMEAADSPNMKKMFFNTWVDVLKTEDSREKLYAIWKRQTPPKGVILSEEEFTGLATALALRNHPDSTVLQEQLARVKNEDRKLRLRFLMPALSADSSERDAFFASLELPSNREKEAWVGSALRYLHHPLREGHSEKYIQPSLEMLEEIQRTGDIFFPQNWLSATLGSYNSKTAAETVRKFLKEHPDYNERLKNKLLQASDDLMRAEKLAWRRREDQ